MISEHMNYTEQV